MSAEASVAIKRGHPKGLYILFFAEMWERFSFYGMKALLLFYFTRFFHYSDDQGYAVYGAYTSLVYATPVLGGWIADKYLGFRKAVVVGGVLMALGHFVMALPYEQPVFLALGLIIVGNGFFKPNISTIVGRLYEDGDPRRDAGFTFFYMGINLGAGVSSVLCGWIGETYGWHWGFSLAGFGMIFGLVVFLWGQRFLEGRADPPNPEALKAPVGPFPLEVVIYLGSIVAVAAAWGLVQLHTVVGYMFLVIGALVGTLLIVYAFTKTQGPARGKMIVAIILIFFSMIFWAFFEQAGSSMNLFTERNVDRTVFGIEIPPSVFQSVNPAFIILFGPIFAVLWTFLGNRNKEPSTPIKFGLGVVQLGLGFGALYLGASSTASGIVPLFWLMLGILLHTTGELCLSPVGLSMVTKLSPKAIVGLMMGTWFLSSAFAQYIASLIAALTGVKDAGEGAGPIPPSAETVMVYGNVFGGIAVIALVIGALMLAVAPILRRNMHDVN